MGATTSVERKPTSLDATGNGTVNTESQSRQLSIEDRIRIEAKEFHDVDTLVKIAKCESSLKPICLEYNAECINSKNNSFDRGLFQISRKWHPEVTDECAFDLSCAVKSAIKIYEKAGWETWACYKLIDN